MVRLLLGAMVLAWMLPASGQARGLVQAVSNAAVFLLFFLNGVRLPRRDVLAGLNNHRLLWPLALFSFGFMALLGWLIWQAGQGQMPVLLALGFLYLGCLPSTVQSATAYTSLAGGNVAASVVAAALLNLIGVVVSAPLFAILGGGERAGIDLDALMRVMALLLVPFALGQIVQAWLADWARGHRQTLVWLDRATILIAVYSAFSGAVSQHFWDRVDLAGWLWLAGGSALMLALAHWGAWVLSGVLGLARGDRIVMLFSGAQKSVAMGAPMAAVLFSPAAAGVILLPLLLYHLAQLMLAAPIAARLNPD